MINFKKFNFFSCILFLLAALMLSGCSCGRQEEETETKPPEIEVAETTPEVQPTVAPDFSESIQQALTNARPEDGSRISQGNFTLSWPASEEVTDDFELTVLLREETEEEWQQIETDNPHRAPISGLEAGSTYYYKLLLSDGTNEYKGDKTKIEIVNGPHFTTREKSFSIERDFEQHFHVTVKNPSDKEFSLKLFVENSPDDLILGFVGDGSEDQELVIKPNQSAKIPLVFFAQNAKVGVREAVVGLKGQKDDEAIEDYITLKAEVEKPEFNLQVTKGNVDPVTLATTLRIRNLGDTISDLTISSDGENASRVTMVPQLRHYRLRKNDVVSTTIHPRLLRGDTGFEALIKFSSAGQSMEFPLTFEIEEDKRAFVASTYSTVTEEVESSFCSNRPDINELLDLDAAGPIPDPSRPFIYCPERGYIPVNMPLWRRTPLQTIFFYFRRVVGRRDPLEIRGQRISTGVRGGTIRENVAAHFPDLEIDNAEFAHLIADSKGMAAVWHTPTDNGQKILYTASLEEGKTLESIKLASSEGMARWPTISGKLGETIIAAWEDDTNSTGMELYVRRSTDKGVSWDEPQKLTEHGQGAYDPIVISNENNWYIVWEDGRNGIFLRRSKDDGKTWLPEQQLAEGNAVWPQIVLDENNIWCTFAVDNRIYVVNSEDEGKTWTSPEPVSDPDADSGEPALAIKDNVVHLAWRQEKEEQPSTIKYSRLLDESWTNPVIISHDGIGYAEYPSFIVDRKGIKLFYVAPSLNQGYLYTRETDDNGETWSDSERLAMGRPNVKKAYLITDFSLPWDLSKYRPHDVEILINGHQIEHIKNVIPEGPYIFPVDPRLLNFCHTGPAKNEISLRTTHMNHGHYVVNTGFKIIMFMSHQERTVVASSQQEADKLARAIFGREVNHDRPDPAIFRNLIRGLPTHTTEPQTISLTVPIANIGPVDLSEAVFKAEFLNSDGENEPVAEPIQLPVIPSARTHEVSFDFEHDGSAKILRLKVTGHPLDADPESSYLDLRLGLQNTGELKLIKTAPEDEYNIVSGAYKTNFGTLKPGESIELYVDSYDLYDKDNNRVLNNISIRGGETTLVDPEMFGTIEVVTADSVRMTSVCESNKEIDFRSNEPLRLSPGFYRLFSREDSSLVFPDVTVAQNSNQRIHAQQHGWIRASLTSQVRMFVIDHHGDIVARGWRNEAIRVPPGTYRVKADKSNLVTSGVREIISDPVHVGPGKTTRLTMPAGGLRTRFFTSSSGGMYISIRIFDENDEQIMRTQANNTLVLPPGDYTVHMRGSEFPVTVVKGEVNDVDFSTMGGLYAENFGRGANVRVINSEGEDIGRIHQGRDYRIVVPVGEYTVKTQEHEVKVTVESAEWTKAEP